MSLASKAIASRGVFSVMLSGGSTPRALHERLTDSELTGKLEWASVHVFWGDERCVPPDHADSNYRMARETLLDYIPIPLNNIHRILLGGIPFLGEFLDDPTLLFWILVFPKNCVYPD